jgi:hypothetical protein
MTDEEKLLALQAEFDTEINRRIQIFIGRPCSYVYATLLELSLNRFLDAEVFKEKIALGSIAKLSEIGTNYEQQTLNYNVTLLIPYGIETITLNTTYIANIGSN